MPEPLTHAATFQFAAWHHNNIYVADCTCVGVDLLDAPCIPQSDLMSQQSRVLKDCSGSKLQQAKHDTVKPVLYANDTWTRNSSSSSSSGLSVLLTSRV